MEQNKISGVYKITNNITGDFYVGSSCNIKQRWAVHKCVSAWKLQPNSKLYQDMSQYGKNNFIFEVLEETTDLRNREQYWIEQLKPSYNNNWAKGWNTEQYKKAHKEAHRRLSKEWNEIHRDERLAYGKAYYSRICFYEGETLTLNTLSARFCYQGIPHPTLEAKKYLIERSINDESV